MSKFSKLNKTAAKLITSAGALALMAGLSLAMAPEAQAWDCLLDTNNDGNADSNVDTDAGADSSGFSTRLACGTDASAAGSSSTALGSFSSAAGSDSAALGRGASAAGDNATAIGNFAGALENGSTALGTSTNAGVNATAVGRSVNAGSPSSTALGNFTSAVGFASTAVGSGASATGNGSTVMGVNTIAVGKGTVALGSNANAAGLGSISVGLHSAAALNAIAMGGDGDADANGAQALGDNSIVIGADADGGSFADAVVIGFGATATEANQVILKDADTFTILGNGDVGIGTAAPLANLDINSGVDDTTLLLTNTSAQWELKSKAATGRLNFKNITDGGVPFKLGPNSVNGLLSVGTMANDLVEVRGDLEVEGDVEVTGTLTTGGPTCGGGCDAVFGADYDLPSIEEHARAMYANSYLPEIGPTVPKAAINVSERMGTMLNELEKAHIYIAQQQQELAEIKAQLAILMNK